MSVRRRHDVPQSIRALSTMSPPSYVDLFVADVADATSHSPEQWARAAVEGASEAGRFLAWRAALGLRLSDAPDRIGGWRVGERGDGWIRVEAESWFLTAHMVFVVEPGLVSLATFVRYDRRLGALVWPPVSAVHRSVAPGFLAGAVHRLRS
jgi:hypothetical protein